MNRRSFLRHSAGAGAVALLSQSKIWASPPPHALGFHFTDATSTAGIHFRHNNGAYGGKLLPETLGPGCAFIDYDADGWQDILLVNSMDWPGHARQRSTPKLYRNNRNGTFTDVTHDAGLDIEMYGLGVAVADVCNYVKWSPEHDVFCSLDGKHKSYCTPEAYVGQTCWLFRNRGNGTFEDATASSGIFDSSSKSLGVALLDYEQDGWPDLLVANDTQPNKLYRNQRNGTFRDVAVDAGIAFSQEGKARGDTRSLHNCF